MSAGTSLWSFLRVMGCPRSIREAAEPASLDRGTTELDLGAFWVVSGRAFGWYFLYYGSQKSRGVLFLEKKGPCQECPGCRRNWFSQKINNSRNSDQQSTIFRKGTRGKITPPVFSIQCMLFVFTELIHFEETRKENTILYMTNSRSTAISGCYL